MARNIIIYISGIDGSGKTTLATILEQQLRKLGLPVIRIWFRFPYFALYPLLVLAHKLNLTKNFKYKNKTFTVHFFKHMAIPYTLLYLIDFTLHYLLRIRCRSLLPLILIVDRGPIDSVIDLMTDAEFPYPSKQVKLALKYFINLQLRGLTILADASFEVIAKRRPEILIDPKSRLRYLLYKFVFQKCCRSKSMIVFNTEKSLRINYKKLVKVSEVIGANYGHIGYGKKVRNPYFRALLASKCFILVNWLFQGIFIADITENIIRFVIDILLPLLIFILTSNLILSIFMFIIAHTINYIFNSNSPIIILYMNKKINMDLCLKKIEQYIKRRNVSKGIRAILVFGSLTKGKASKYSDIDIRIVRKQGIINAIKTFVWTAKLRWYALRQRIPMDIFISTYDKLNKIIENEELQKQIILYDSNR